VLNDDASGAHGSQLRRCSAVLNGPAFHFGNRHERDRGDASGELGIVTLAQGVIFEEEGNDGVATMTGSIPTPSVRIEEGAFCKGRIETA
jgi:hypothetical protein